MKWVRTALPVVCLLLMSTQLFAQLTADATIPPTAEPYTCVVVSVKSPAKFANLKVLGKATFAPVTTFALKDLPDGTRTWNFTGPPDEYLVWIDLFDPELGIATEVGKCVIGTPPNPPEPPGPDPEPEPEPGGPYQIMMFWDEDQAGQITKGQQALLTSLVYRDRLETLGHVFLEVLEKKQIQSGVPGEYKVFLDAVVNDPMPRVAVAPKEGGKVIDIALPDGFEALQSFLNDPALERVTK